MLRQRCWASTSPSSADPSPGRGRTSVRDGSREVGCWAMVEMELVGVRVELPDERARSCCCGRPSGDRRMLPIFIGGPRRRPSPSPSRGRDPSADDPRPAEGPARRARRAARADRGHRARATAPSSPRSTCGPATARTRCPAGRPTPSPSRCGSARRSSPTRTSSTRPATRPRTRGAEARGAEEVVEQFREFIDR